MPKLLAAAALVLLPGAPALGAPAKPRASGGVKSRHLWATVDACNPPSMPRVIGVRGSMPGTGVHGELMFMRFRIQYRSGAGWRFIPAADSGFRSVGAATYKALQSGQYFTIRPVPDTYVLRGVVSFQWRRAGHTVLRAERVTTPGHLALTGADPPGYSAGVCSLPPA